MPDVLLQTHHLDLHVQSTEEVLARIEALAPEHRAEVSPEWLERVRTSTEPSAWTHGFAIVERMSGEMIGSCAFVGPPDAEGVVEIAYEIAPAHQRLLLVELVANARAIGNEVAAFIAGVVEKTIFF